MKNRTFDILAMIGRIVLPAVATLYGTLSGIWGLPYGEAIVATISAVALFLNALLKVDTTKNWEPTIGYDRPLDEDRCDEGKGEVVE